MEHLLTSPKVKMAYDRNALIFSLSNDEAKQEVAQNPKTVTPETRPLYMLGSNFDDARVRRRSHSPFHSIQLSTPEASHPRKTKSQSWLPSFVKAKDSGAEASNDDQQIIEGTVMQARSLLNKITSSTFNKFTKVFINLLINQPDAIGPVFEVLFKKAVDEELYCKLYTRMIFAMSLSLPLNVVGDNVTTHSKNAFHDIFHSGLQNLEEVKLLESNLTTETDTEKKREMNLEIELRNDIARRRSLGSMQLIGEFYLVEMLSPLMIIECINECFITASRGKDEHAYECLCKLVSTVGKTLEKWKMNPIGYGSPVPAYLDKLFFLLYNSAMDSQLSARTLFKMMDVCDMRRNNWLTRRDLKEAEERLQCHNCPASAKKSPNGNLKPGGMEWEKDALPSGSAPSPRPRPNFLQIPSSAVIPRIEITSAERSPRSSGYRACRTPVGDILKSPCLCHNDPKSVSPY